MVAEQVKSGSKMSTKPRNSAQFAPRRGLSEVEAANYISVSQSFFRQLVAIGRMPAPRVLGRRRVWDILEIDAAFAAFPHDGECDDGTTDNSWSDY